MDFGRVLTRSWEIIWKYKALWIFGILSSCGSGGANFGNRFNFQMDSRSVGNLPPQMQQMVTNWQQFFSNNTGLVIGLICLFLLLAVLFWAIGVFGRIGVIKGALEAEEGRPVGFRGVAGEVWAILGSALGLNVLLVLIPLAVIIVFVILAVLFSVITLGIGLLCVIPLVCVLIILGIAYSVLIDLANVALVKEGKGVSTSIKLAWEMLRDQLGPLAGMALILILGGFLVRVILLLPFIAVAAPAFLAFAASNNNPSAIGQGLLISGILLVIALPIYLVLSGIVRSYILSAWTLTYAQLAPAPPAPPKRITRSSAKPKAKK